MRSSVLTDIRTVTAMSPMIAIQNAHAFDLSDPNRLVIANQNAHAFGLSSAVARMKMKTKPKSLVVAMTKRMVAIRQDHIHLLHFASSSASWPPRPLSSLIFNFEDDLARLFLKSS